MGHRSPLRKTQNESGAPAGSVLYFQACPVQAGQFLGNGKSQSKIEFVGSAGVRTIETLKDMFFCIIRDAGTMIDYRNGNRLSICAARKNDLYCAPLRCMFDCVAQEDGEQLAEPFFVCLNPVDRSVRQEQRQRMPALLRQKVKLVIHFNTEIIRGKQLQIRRHIFKISVGEKQQIVCQMNHPIRFALRAVQQYIPPVRNRIVINRL